MTHSQISGPVQPGTSEEVFRSTGVSTKVFVGPIQPGTSETVFRSTGRSVPRVSGGTPKVFVGPVQPGTSEEVFRSTGKSVAKQIKIPPRTAQTIQTQVRELFEESKTQTPQERQRSIGAFFGDLKTERQRGFALRDVDVPQVNIRKQPLLISSQDVTRDRTPFEVGKEVLFGRTGEKFLGIGSKSFFGTGLFNIGIGAKEPAITLREIKEFGRRGISPKAKEKIAMGGGFVLSSFVPLSKESSEKFLSKSVGVLSFQEQVVSELIPTTPGGVAIVGGTVALGLTFPIVRPIISGTFGVLGTKTALSSELTPQERVAGGLVGALGFAGFGFEITPFVRGAKARLSSEFKPVKTQPEGFKAIELGEGQLIGLIEPKKGSQLSIDLPKLSPLIKGGFRRRPGGEEIFLGKGQVVATSQRDFFKEGKVIPLEKEFFVTPQEPFIKIAETRISRLSLIDLFKRQKETEIGFGLPEKPQIGIARADVGRVETQTQLRIGTGTELEAIKGFGEIKDIRKIGKTVVKGQGVDIFEFSFGKGIGKGLGIKSPKLSSTGGVGKVSGESLISTLGITSKTSRLSIPIGVSLGLSLPKSSDILSSIKPGTGLIPSGGITPTGFTPGKITPRTPSLSGFSLPPSSFSPPSIGDFFETPIIGPPVKRKRPKGKRVRKAPKKKRRKIRIPIRPSFTGIITGIEDPAFTTKIAGVDVGILPGQIRGLRTGLAPPRRKTKKKAKKSSKKTTKKSKNKKK